MTHVIDRRDRSGSGVASRQRFLDRYKKFAKKAIDKAISNGNITDIGRGGTDVTIPKDDLSEPTIHHGKGGINHRVIPGNKEFQTGDRIPRPRQQRDKGRGDPSEDGGDDEDDFTFHITEEEFLNYMFEDLALPNMTKENNMDPTVKKLVRAGLGSQGPQNQIDLARSRQRKMGRMIASEGPLRSQILELLREKIELFTNYELLPSDIFATLTEPQDGWRSKKQKITSLENELHGLRGQFQKVASFADAARAKDIEQEIAKLEKKMGLIPRWNESTDMRVRNFEMQAQPNSKAVMFCIMDVSGSMDQEKKDNAKIFYMLLYRFLKRHYDTTEVVFIRHTEVAEEVTEEQFFYDRKTGGTKVSPAINKTLDIIRERYPVDEWNIYGAQASDGDNMYTDGINVTNAMRELLPLVQGYFHVEIPHSYIDQDNTTDLWDTYEPLASEFKDRFWMGQVMSRKDIWPLFRDFFKRRGEMENAAQPRAAAFMPQ